MSDLISRQAVLETQAKYAEHMGATKFWQMRDDIRALPPVTPQPEKRTEERTEKHACDCISRQAALDIAKSSKSNWIDNSVLFKRINDLPPVTPQPEVIRCKDCKHWTNNIGDSELRDNYCNEEAHGFYYRCSGDDYCSFAERRTDG